MGRGERRKEKEANAGEGTSTPSGNKPKTSGADSVSTGKTSSGTTTSTSSTGAVYQVQQANPTGPGRRYTSTNNQTRTGDGTSRSENPRANNRSQRQDGGAGGGGAGGTGGLGPVDEKVAYSTTGGTLRFSRLSKEEQRRRKEEEAKKTTSSRRKKDDAAAPPAVDERDTGKVGYSAFGPLRISRSGSKDARLLKEHEKGGDAANRPSDYRYADQVRSRSDDGSRRRANIEEIESGKVGYSVAGPLRISRSTPEDLRKSKADKGADHQHLGELEADPSQLAPADGDAEYRPPTHRDMYAPGAFAVSDTGTIEQRPPISQEGMIDSGQTSGEQRTSIVVHDEMESLPPPMRSGVGQAPPTRTSQVNDVGDMDVSVRDFDVDGEREGGERVPLKDSKNGTRGFFRNHWKAVAAVSFVIVVALVVILSVLLTRDDGSSDGPSPTPPASNNQASFEDMKQILVENGFSEEDTLNEQTSPQHQALNWIANEDKFPIDKEPTGWDIAGLVQRYSLAVLHFSTGNEDKLKPDEDDECEWTHVACLSQFPRPISSVTLGSLFVPEEVGVIPPELQFLSSLETLTLNKNNIVHLPMDSLGKLTNLKYLSLKENSITGIDLGDNSPPPKLAELYLEGNKINGTIPSALYEFESLEILKLDWNYIAGVISPSISKLSNLKVLSIKETNLRGSIAALKNLPKLTHVDLIHNNFLSGDVSVDLPLQQTLKFLFLAQNDFTGQLPTEIGALNFLQKLDLSVNSLVSTIPTEMGSATSLERLNLAENNGLNGTMPTELGQLINLEFLNVESTSLSGNVPEEVCVLKIDDFRFDCADLQCPQGCCDYCES